MSEQNWVLVASIQAEVQAELLRGLLEAQEIPVLLSREGTWLICWSLGGSEHPGAG